LTAPAATPVAPAGPTMRLIAEIVLAVIGFALTVGAILADQAWFDRHFLPVFFLSRRLYVLGETLARIAVGLVGLTVALIVRPMVGRAMERSTPAAVAAAALRSGVALALAVGLSELALGMAFPRATEEASPREEPLRRPDPRLGWVFVPSRVGHAIVGGRGIDYAFDSHGDRVPGPLDPVDPTRPTVLFTGESIMTGFGLRWRESVPALVGAALGTQSANLAVFGYADDQAYMRLAEELPRFAHPTAVVMLFSPTLIFRDFDDDRPRLAPGMIRRPALRRWRLEALVRFFVPYHSRQEIDRTVDQIRAELRASVRLAHARDAAALIVVPHYGPEQPDERVLRHRILDQPGLPYVWVDLNPAWRIPHDPHPDARGAQAIANAVVARLRRQAAP